MRAQVIIEDINENYKEVVNVDNIDDKKHFSYIDSYGVNNDVRVFNDGITIFRNDLDHKTYVVLRDKAYIKIKSNEGDISFSVKVLALCINNDIISIAYCVSDSQKRVEIRFIGEKQ